MTHALVARPFSRNRPAIDNAVNSAPYRHCGSTEWLHLRFIATATSRVQTTHVSFRSRTVLRRYAALKSMHSKLHEVGPFLKSGHIYRIYSNKTHANLII